MKIQTLFGRGFHSWTFSRVALSLCAMTAAACSSATEPSLVLTTTPDFSATVAQVQLESGNSPGGPISQYDVWVTIPPAAAPNAGVVVPTSAAIFVRTSDGRLMQVAASAIKVGDKIDVWHDRGVAFGAVQAPAGAPSYGGTQIVIAR